jgi:hypothetical protein
MEGDRGGGQRRGVDWGGREVMGRARGGRESRGCLRYASALARAQSADSKATGPAALTAALRNELCVVARFPRLQSPESVPSRLRSAV